MLSQAWPRAADWEPQWTSPVWDLPAHRQRLSSAAGAAPSLVNHRIWAVATALHLSPPRNSRVQPWWPGHWTDTGKPLCTDARVGFQVQPLSVRGQDIKILAVTPRLRSSPEVSLG